MGGDTRLIGLWRKGQLVQELFETFVPALDLDAIEGEEWQKVYGGMRETPEETERKRKEKEKAMRAGTSGSMTSVFEDSVAETASNKQEQPNDSIEGEAVILYLSGDKYVGHVKDGRKDGLGM